MTDSLRDRLADVEAEHATLRAELRAFHADYMRRVGTIMAEVHELDARILAIVAERSGAAADRRAAAQAGARAARTHAELRAVPAPGAPLPDGDLRQLFREAAKRMHPDLVRDPDGRPHAEAFMKRLNEAYRAVDAVAVRDLLLQWSASPYAPASESSGARRASASRASGEPRGLRAAVARAEERLAQERASDVARLMERVMAAAAAGRDLLAEMRADAQTALAQRRARLAELGG